MALKRIQRITLAAQNTARCVKHPVIDRSLARARTASVASANRSDTRLENAERETFAQLRNDAVAQSIHDANDKNADNCAMSVDGPSDDDGSHMSERGDGDRRQECDRSNLSDASEHEHDDDEDIEDNSLRVLFNFSV